MKSLLIEQYPASFRIIEEAGSNPSKLLKIRCDKMSEAGVRNGNGRVYPLEVWEREINKLQKKIQEGALIGAADHPADGLSRISDSAIKWTKIALNGPLTMGEGYVLPTSKGRDLEALIRSGVTVDISSRAWGSLIRKDWNGETAEVACDDLDLCSFDAVLGGSVQGSHLTAVNEQGTEGGHRSFSDAERLQRVLAGLSQF